MTDHNIWTALFSPDPLALRAWLASLGFEDGILVMGPDGKSVQHSEMTWPEGGRVMVASRTEHPGDDYYDASLGAVAVYVVTDHPDEVHARAVALGARIVRPLEGTDYGSRGFSIVDPDGNRFSFGTYAG